MQLCSKEEIFLLLRTRGWSVQEEQPGCGATLHGDQHYRHGNQDSSTCHFDSLCFHLQNCFAEGTLVPVRYAIRATVRVGLPRAVHAPVYKLFTDLQKE